MDELLVIDDQDEATPPPESDYLLMLAYRLKGLIEVLRKLEQAAVAHYCRLIASTVEALSPLYATQGLLPRGAIDRDDSGFPCTEDLLFLFSEWLAAEASVKAGTSEAELLTRMRRRIFSGEFPTEEHAALGRMSYLSRIRGSELAEEFRILNPLLLKETEFLRFIRQGWRGWDARAGVFRHYFAFFAQQRGTRPFERIREDSELAARLREGFQRPLAELLEPLSFRDDSQPKSVDRYTIGPYYVPCPENAPAIRGLFDGLEHPFILKLTLERVIVESSLAQPALIHEFLGEDRPRPVSLREQRSRYVLCSPEVQTRLGAVDERGEPATLWALDRRGRVSS